MKYIPSVLLFIPLYRPTKDFFKKTLPSLTRQTIKPHILIIHTKEKDEPSLKLSLPEDITYKTINKDDFNHATTRNEVLKYSADYFLFATQDITAFDDYLIENLLYSFDDTKVVLSYARQIAYPQASSSEKFAREANYPLTSMIKSNRHISTMGIKTFFCSNSCAMYRADYFRKIGGFKDGLNMSEDMEFAARAILQGYKVAYQAKAKVYHSHNYTLKTLFYRYYAIGNFFKHNRWILEVTNKHKHIEHTGISQVLKEFKFLLKNDPLHLPRAFIQTLIKYIAYKRGFYG